MNFTKIFSAVTTVVKALDWDSWKINEDKIYIKMVWEEVVTVQGTLWAKIGRRKIEVEMRACRL